MSEELSSGILRMILSCNDPDNLPDKPLLQVLGVKKLQSQGTDRYRLVLSDGDSYYTSCMLGTQLNHEVCDGGVEVKAIVRLDKYTCNVIQGTRKIIVALEIGIATAAHDVSGKIGEPVQMTDQEAASLSAAAPKAPQSNSAFKPSVQKQQNNNNFYQNQNRAPNNQQPTQDGGKTVFPIASLTPYQNRWTIRARVTNRSQVRTWSNSRGDGKLFNVDLIDESGEIRATGFNDAVDKYYEMMEAGKVFYITKGSLKTANKQYSTLKNDYEMSINNDTTIEPCLDAGDSLPQIQYNFKPINKLEDIPKDTLVDLLGVVKSAGEMTTITTKATNKEIQKRDIDLLDQSGVTVRVTLWGGEADSWNKWVGQQPVVAIKGAKLSDFGGRTVSVLNSSVFNVNPDINEAHALRGWFDKSGSSLDAKSISMQGSGGGGGGGSSGPFKVISQIKEEGLGREKPDYFSIRGTVVYYRKENCMYMACPTEECNKKVSEENGTYRCEKCDKSYPNYKYRMILSCNVADFTGNQWVTAFQESGEKILGLTAAELGNFKDNDEQAFDKVFSDATFKTYTIKVRAKFETYQDEERLKCSAVAAEPVDFLSESKRLQQLIETMEASQ